MYLRQIYVQPLPRSMRNLLRAPQWFTTKNGYRSIVLVINGGLRIFLRISSLQQVFDVEIFCKSYSLDLSPFWKVVWDGNKPLQHQNNDYVGAIQGF